MLNNINENDNDETDNLLPEYEETELVQTKRENAKQKKPKDYKSQEDEEKDKIDEMLRKAEQFKSMIEHKIPIKELYQKLDTDPEKGLTEAEARKRNELYGDNTLTEKEKSPWYLKLFSELVSPFALILWVGAILSFLVYFLGGHSVSNVYLGLVLVVIILVSGLGAFMQNYKSEAIMENFKNFIPPKAKVIRNGELNYIMAVKLVPGDIIEIKDGDRIPADMRIIWCTEMKVDHSSLNGESDALPRSAECTNEHNPLETENLCFFGTLCKEGSCRGVVLQIGDNTVMGQIATLASSTGPTKTPLQKEMDRFVIIIAVIAVIMGVLFFFIGFALKYTVMTNLLYAVGLITGNAPEGLLVFVTVLLTVCAKRLAGKFVLAKNLQSVETLGATTCICSDKTGTLTQNIMTVENVWYDGLISRAINKQKYPNLEPEYDPEAIGFQTLHEVAIGSSEAVFNPALPSAIEEKLNKISNPRIREQELQKELTEWKTKFDKMLWIDKPTIGDASESALIKFFQPIKDIHETRAKHPIVKVNNMACRVKFNSTNKFALSIVEYPLIDSHYCIFIKGAPEAIWRFCDKIQDKGDIQPIDDIWKNGYRFANEVFGNNGERVLGFAKLHLPKDKFPQGYEFNTNVSAKGPKFEEWNFPLKEMTFIGLISLVDPPRDDVPYSIIRCKSAGIKVIMVTGDQPVTALAIAKKVNIIDQNAKTNLHILEVTEKSPDEAIAEASAIVIHGDQLTEAAKKEESLPDEEKGKILEGWLQKKQIVFARTSPAQKLSIVNACQKLGHIVAVTGDGVNDSPAIKKADIGIAMGITGSDVAKDAADLVLLTDDFSAIVVGIEEGRKLYDNLKKCISYSLTTNIPEMVPFMILILFKIPLPATTILLLCLSIGTDMFPAISFAYEDAELDIMVKPPRDREEHLVTKQLLTFSYLQIGVFEAMAAFLTYFIIMADFGFPFWSLFGLSMKEGWQPKPTDRYDPNSPTFGNTNIEGACQNQNDLENPQTSPYAQYWYQPDWIYGQDQPTDMRMVFVRCEVDDEGNLTGGVENLVKFGQCEVKQESSVTHKPICYTVEALKYAQIGFFASVVVCQWSNVTINKTRRVSVYYHGFENFYMTWGLVSETLFVLLLAYLPFCNIVMGTRDDIPMHLGLPALPFSLLILLYDETRKALVANSISKKKGEPDGWWATYCVW